jgi:ubiquinone/menaquinone biosynthesis C-methylase UbiE
MAQFHFVDAHERLVAQLIEKYPIDEAMSLAVGGFYQKIGTIEADILRYVGLTNGTSVIDLGCGSGRLASVLGQSMNVEFTGIDIVQSLLDYAKAKAPSNYRFLLHRELNIPAHNNQTDFVSAFSVFTHLLHAETYIYLQDIKRVLKKGGKLVFSFLEFSLEAHWAIFEATVDAQKNHSNLPVNMFIERSTIDTWCRKLGYKVEAYIPGSEAPWRGEPLGESTAIVRNA